MARKVELAQVGFGVGVRTVFDGKYLWKSSLDPRDVKGVLKPLGRGWPGFQCESQPCLKGMRAGDRKQRCAAGTHGVATALHRFLLRVAYMERPLSVEVCYGYEHR